MGMDTRKPTNRGAQVVFAAALIAVVVFTGMLTASILVQLMPGERPGICGRDCY